MNLITITINPQTNDWPSWIQAGCAILALIITGIGTYYIVRTFQKQSLINTKQVTILEQQNELNSIALKKHIRDIRPIFSIENIDQKDLARATYTISVKTSMARNILFEELNYRQTIIKSTEITGAYPNAFLSTFRVAIPSFNTETVSKVLRITYEDEEERIYRQVVHLLNTKLSITFPAVIKDHSRVD